jgi:peptidyl-prolyl cis-trans isomerase C
MTSLHIRIAAALFAIAVSSCSREPVSGSLDETLGPGQVATVDGEPIPESVYRLYAMATLKKNADELTAEERRSVIDDLIGFKLLAAAAQERGLLGERAVAAQLELQRMQSIARTMAVRHLEENPATEAELQEVYEQNLPRLSAAQYKARHILVETREAAEAVIEELQEGKDFIALAQEHADGPTGPNGGDLGWMTVESMTELFGDAVQTIEVGAYSREPIQTDFGFHVVMVEETRAQEPPALDQLRAELTSAVDRMKLDRYIQQLREAAVVSND